MQHLKRCFVCHCKFPFQKLPLEIFIHWKEKSFRVLDHPVCHCLPGNGCPILFPVFFLTEIRQRITELLVHHPCNGACTSHSVKHMWPAIFSLFNNRDPMLTALRAFIIPAVILTHFQPCRNKNQFTADKLFTDLFQSRTADRTVFLFLRKIQIFFFHRDPFETFCISCPGFAFLWSFFRRRCFQFFHLRQCRILFQFCFIKKVQLPRNVKDTLFTGGAKKLFPEKIDFFFQVVSFLRKGFFPFVGSIDSCLKRFYHFLKIMDHVLQLSQLDIFRTVCHCFFLLFLILLLYQKTGVFPSKTAVFQYLKMPKIPGI